MKDKLDKFITNTKSNVFCLKSNSNPELEAALLARYSRAPYGIKDVLIKEFFDKDGNAKIEKGSKLIDRVLNKFGDESVGELAVTSLCLENISNLATKYIEDLRIGGSPIEQSTRYVLYDKKINNKYRYYTPSRLIPEIKSKYEETMDFLFDTYVELIEPMMGLFRKRLPENKFEIEVERQKKIIKVKKSGLINDIEIKAFDTAYKFTIRSAACDIIRCILPAATCSNMGIVGNGRFFTHLISNLITSNIGELNDISKKTYKEVEKIIPTFIKRSKVNYYKKDINENMISFADKIFKKYIPEFTDYPNDDVLFIDPNNTFFNVGGDSVNAWLMINMLFPYTHHSSHYISNVLCLMEDEELRELIETYIGDRKDKRNKIGKAFESGYPINFEIIGGFGIYRDLHRHRQCTHVRQKLNPNIGYSIPDEIHEIKMTKKVESCFKKSKELYNLMIKNGYKEEAQYTVLFNHYIRWYMGMNYRELEHICELRTQKAGHHSYRRIAQKMAKLFAEHFPNILYPILNKVDWNDYNDGIARAEQEAKTARKSISTGVEDL